MDICPYCDAPVGDDICDRCFRWVDRQRHYQHRELPKRKYCDAHGFQACIECWDKENEVADG